MTLYFDCQLTKTHSFRLFFWWFLPTQFPSLIIDSASQQDCSNVRLHERTQSNCRLPSSNRRESGR